MTALPDHTEPHTEAPQSYGIPRYEGKEVSLTKIKVGSTVGLDIDNAVLRMDNIIRFVAEGRVVGVNHVVNEKTGEMERIQTVRVIEIDIVPWGQDEGVL